MAEGGVIKCSTNLFTIADATYREQLRAKFFGDAIPATSFAAGANDMGRGLKSYNMHDYIVTSWPRKDSDGKSVWYHSDIKNVAYYFTHKLFKKVMNGE